MKLDLTRALQMFLKWASVVSNRYLVMMARSRVADPVQQCGLQFCRRVPASEEVWDGTVIGDTACSDSMEGG